jgi:hypothetical protein
MVKKSNNHFAAPAVTGQLFPDRERTIAMTQIEDEQRNIGTTYIPKRGRNQNAPDIRYRMSTKEDFLKSPTRE